MSHERPEKTQKTPDELAEQIVKIGGELTDRAKKIGVPVRGEYGDTTLSQNSNGDRYLRATTGSDTEGYTGLDMHTQDGYSFVRWTEEPAETRRKAAKDVYGKGQRAVTVRAPKKGRRSLRHPIRKSADVPASFSTYEGHGHGRNSETTSHDISRVATALGKMRGRLADKAMADEERHRKAS